MALIVLTDAKLAFGHVDLLANTAFSLEAGERVGLILPIGQAPTLFQPIIGKEIIYSMVYANLGCPPS